MKVSKVTCWFKGTWKTRKTSLYYTNWHSFWIFGTLPCTAYCFKWNNRPPWDNQCATS